MLRDPCHKQCLCRPRQRSRDARAQGEGRLVNSDPVSPAPGSTQTRSQWCAHLIRARDALPCELPCEGGVPQIQLYLAVVQQRAAVTAICVDTCASLSELHIILCLLCG